MSNLQFTCTACAQPIECDKQFAGQQLSCPYCQAVVTAPSAPTGKPQGRINLTVAAPPPAASHAPAPTVIAPPSFKPKSKDKKQKIIAGVAIAAVLVGLVVAFPYLKGLQEKVTGKLDEASEGSDGGELGHIADLHATLDATDPARYDSRRSRSAPEEPPGSPAPANPGTPAPSSATLPIVEPVHNLDIEQSEIPKSKLNGVITGETFTPDVVRFDKSGNAYVLLLRQGTNTFDREMTIVLRLKPGQSIETNSFIVSKDLKSGTPQVVKKWKTGPRYFAQKSFSTGYAMKLEFGKIADGILPGKIYVALPDKEATVVAGHFEAETRLVSAAQQPPAQ